MLSSSASNLRSDDMTLMVPAPVVVSAPAAARTGHGGQVPRSRSWLGGVVTMLAVLLVAAAPLDAKKKPKGKKSRTAADRAEIEALVRSDVDERPIAGVSVTLQGNGFEGEATSDADGRFEITVPEAAGQYRIALSKDGFASFDTELSLEAGQRSSFTFSLIDAQTGRRQEAMQTYNEGAELYQANDMAGAKAKFLMALEADPERVEAQLGLANVYLAEEDLDGARGAIERFLAARPDEEGPQRLAFEIYRRQGDLDKLAPMVESLRDTEGAANLAALVYNDGVAALGSQENTRASALFEMAHSLNPTIAEPLAGLATIQYNDQDYEGLEGTLERLAKVAPDHPRSRRLRFLLHDARNETEAAQAAFEAYHAVDGPAAIDLLYKRADLDFRESRPEVARVALERILELSPDHGRAHFTLGLVMASSDDTAAARKHLNRFLELLPDDPDAATAREMLPHLGG